MDKEVKCDFCGSVAQVYELYDHWRIECSTCRMTDMIWKGLDDDPMTEEDEDEFD